MFSAFAFLNDQGDFVGGCAISGYRQSQYGNDCDISCASETSMAARPHVFTAVFNYVFVQLKCVRLTCVTTKRNKRARAFIERMGFELEGNVRLGYDGKRDALIYGLLAADCRYLAGGQHGFQERTERATAA
jgi:RimJ/RimL family protein N-acetyltransferase